MQTAEFPATATTSAADLAHRHRAALLAYVRGLIGDDAASAEDVVQETIIRAWQHPEAFQPGKGSARGWLFTVARNLAMDVHRRRHRLAETTVPVVERTHDGGWIDAVLDRHVIDAALDELTPEQREAISAVYLRGLAIDDVARRLGVPPGTVKSRAYYGLRNLKQILCHHGLRQPD
ncbi:sigma-70 family RNA polymerase sigma factor [Micromonospora sp. Llam7]|uniref:sigma-70 family RNA polymerase sigma factor n=1 Tax=Micromonospora tarapacensis TaxID=2835305 RepID=UPI001C834409|nr:sigma-70 family RNA polymerase sigma factor [Micromonospora tarapacensis]MBX7266406.1 sigma-70 family RNA polymerase sigma factor [Micromonospora tarapacensis]